MQIRSGSAVLAVTLALSCATVLVIVNHMVEERAGVELESKGAKPKDATSSTQAIQTILQRMEKKKNVSAHKSQTRNIKDKILQEKSKLANLKVKDSKTFAKWENEDETEESAKTKALSLHEVLQQDKTEEKIYKKKIDDLKAKLSRHLTAKSARNDLNRYYSKLDEQAEKTIPQKIKKLEKFSTSAAAKYKKTMESQHAHALKTGKNTVSLKQLTPAVNVWDTAPGMNEDRVAIAQHHLRKALLDADKQIEKAEANKKR